MKSLECQICFHEFDEWRRRPRILSCGHTFCSICLKSLLKDRNIACPNCKKYHVADNVENININFILESFLSPDDTSKSVEFDTGFKCKEHYYEQNFFCQTHTEWVCRDCIVIKHKPCSHSENCDNTNDCRVITKTERLDLIKSDKISELKIKSEFYGAGLTVNINEYDRKLNSKLILRKDLQKRLKEFKEENNFEIKVLNKKLNFSKGILSNVQKQRNLARLAQGEITKAHGRIAVEESCRNIDKIITSAHEWAIKEKCNIIEDNKYIADVEITLKEFGSLKQKLCETEGVLSDSKNEIRDLECKISEHRISNNHLKSQLNGKEEENLELQNKLEKAIKQLPVNDFNVDVFHACNERILELEIELHQSKNEYHQSKNECDIYKERILSLEKKLDSSVKKCERCINYGKDEDKMKVVETRKLHEVKYHLLNWPKDVYLFTKLFNEKGVLENYYGQLNVYAHEIEDIVLVAAFQKSFSPGSLLVKCPPLISHLESAEYVYLDIGKMEVDYTPTGGTSTRPLGNPFGRLYIELTTSERRKGQMIHICSSLNSEQWKNCNFSVIRNKDRPGELVTCKHYQKIVGINSENNQIHTETYEILYTDLEILDGEIPMDAGNVFGYLDSSAGFSIITRDNYSRDTRWPLLGRVVSGLHYLKEAIMNHDVETIGIHSHGIGFPTNAIKR